MHLITILGIVRFSNSHLADNSDPNSVAGGSAVTKLGLLLLLDVCLSWPGPGFS
jgi:hypothetical protein